MKVLIVDDEEKSIKGIKDHCSDEGWECEISNFEKFYEKIMKWNPDVVVLDWCVDPGDNSGMPILESIWMNGYRPIVIFSGNIDTISLKEEYATSSLIKKYPKGDEQPVNDFLDAYKDYFSVLSEYRDELGKSLVEAFEGINQIKDNEDTSIDNNVVKYLLAKRTVNYFDLERKDITLPEWGMYLYPPILNNSLSTCDILRRVNSSTDLSKIGNPDEYVLVLTPSCDMVNEGTQKAKVKEILCAKCCDKTVFADGIKRKNKIETALNTGFNKQWIALPAYKNVCPALSVDMKDLKIIPLNKVITDKENITEEDTYLRLCSIDSPFREQIVWAYMQTACRPGVPNRDVSSWADSILG